MIGSNPFTLGARGLTIEPGPGLTRRELAHRAAYLARAAIGPSRRGARGLVLSLARRGAAELARLARWYSADVEAVEALPAPVAVGRGPPSRSIVKPCERATSENVPESKGGPKVAATNEKAPGLLPRPSLDLSARSNDVHPSLAMVAPRYAILRVVVAIASDAANLTLTGGRHVLAG
jgi:hypothetical protein